MDVSKYTQLKVEVDIKNNLISETNKNIITKLLQDAMTEYLVKAGLFAMGAVSVTMTKWENGEETIVPLEPDENSFKLGKPTNAAQGD
jgi:hypothetical protein